MKLEVRHVGQVTVVAPTGKLVIGEGETLMNQTTSRLVGEGRVHLVIDLDGVTLMDSSGVDSLVLATRLTQENGGKIKLVHVSRHIYKLLDLTGLTAVIEICLSTEEAISSFQIPEKTA